MRFEHINIIVNDMQETLKFYQAVFTHWKIRLTGEGTWQGVQRKWLHFGDDYQYITFNDNGRKNQSDELYQIGVAHFGVEVRNLAAVQARLMKAGYEPSSPGANHPFRKNAYYLDPNGLEVEFVEYSSDTPNQRNSE